jgi:hypothetical protein
MPRIEKRSLLSLAPLTAPSVTVLCYNISSSSTSSSTDLALRMRVLAKIIMGGEPDAVCLLNVCVPGYQVLQRLLNPRYTLFQVFQEEKEKYGEVLLCHREKTRIVDGTQPYYYDFNVGKGRIIGVELRLHAFEHVIHLLLTKLDDKAENADVRAGQFAIVRQVLEPLDRAILVGDFNLFSVEEPVEQEVQPAKLKDAWVELGCPSALRSPNKNKDLRSTRIYHKDDELHVNRMSLLGTSVLKKLNTQPADHYGLTASFGLRL